MSIEESSTWENEIYELTITDKAKGGRGNIANRQAQQLANRTTWLKEQVEQLQGQQIASLAIDGSGHLIVTLGDESEVDLGSVVGPTGVGMPAGGLVGQMPVKQSLDDYDFIWVDQPTNGEDGADGVSIIGATIDGSGHLIIELSDSTEIDAGAVGGGGGLDDADVAALIADDSPSATRAALDEVIEEVAYSGALLGTAVAASFSIAPATITGNVITSSGSAEAAGLNAAVAKPVAGLVSMGEFRVDAGSSVEFIVANAGGNGMIYGCAEGQWSKTPVTGGAPGAAVPLAFGFGKTASVLLSSAGATALVVEGSLFSLDALFAADATVNSLINMPGSAASVVYTTQGDKYVYDYSAIGLGAVKDVLGRTIKPAGKVQPIGPVLPMVEGGSNPRTYVGFKGAGGFNTDAKVKFQSVNLSVTSLNYSGANVASGALVVVGAGAVVHFATIDCGTADVSMVLAVEEGGIATVGAITGSGVIVDNFNQAPMTETVDGFIRSALTEAH